MPTKPSLPDILRGVTTGLEVADALDSASNLVRSSRTLRRRADTATLKATSARTRLGRAFWQWRADRLNDRADLIEHGQP